jgi:N-acetylglutamate synthase-like GNAT family acetyltransferase/protein-tyrosine-phosphatase
MPAFDVEIAPATPRDAAAIVRLLESCGLPTADVTRHLAHFLVARLDGEVAGVSGLEPDGGYGLLRSLAVDPAHRGRGLARALCSRIEARAAELGVRTLYLLTTTAEEFFAASGFAAVRRASVPDAIRSTLEFSSLCPDSAVVMMKRITTLNVLFLCTGNSARSILAEAYLNFAGKGRFTAHSAGSRPAGKVNPFALELLESNRIPAAGLRSKSWDEFARPGAPKLDFVFTVCDNAAGEACPLWPGQPVREHWGIPDPAAVQGSDDERRRAFARAFEDLRMRIDRFIGSA